MAKQESNGRVASHLSKSFVGKALLVPVGLLSEIIESALIYAILAARIDLNFGTDPLT